MDKDIIAIIAAAALWIISSTLNSKKKKAAAQRQHNKPSPATQNDNSPYETVEFPAMRRDDLYDTADPTPAHREPWSYDSQIIDELTRQTPAAVETERTTPGEQPRSVEAIDPRLRKEMEETDMFNGFNLRDAIIYSELLKPKFEDENSFNTSK